MRITKEQFNKVANLIGTDDKNIVFSAIIKTLVEAGMSVNAAYDHVFGDGAYNKMAGEIYDAIK